MSRHALSAGGEGFDATVLEALGSDDWARVLPLVRAALHDLDDDVAGPAVRRLRAAPTGRLVAGRSRRELCVLVRDDARVRDAVAERVRAADLPASLRAILAGGAPPADADASAPSDAEGELRGLRRRAEQAAGRAERAGRRLHEVRDERDRLLRRLEGAQARAETTRREAERERARVEELRVEVEELRTRLARADEERRRALDRQGRRARSDVEALREEVRTLRRREQERQAELERLRAERRPAPAATPTREPDPGRVVPARPTRLPETVARDTAEEVDHLLSRGRLVAVDGYNVTLRQRPQLDLAGQREWLIRRLATLAAQRGVRPVVVFDGERASAARPAAGVREVEVRFTAAGITADDELLFLVEALPEDEPVLAVTDDRELRGRLVARGVDVVGSGPFVWATPG